MTTSKDHSRIIRTAIEKAIAHLGQIHERTVLMQDRLKLMADLQAALGERSVTAQVAALALVLAIKYEQAQPEEQRADLQEMTALLLHCGREASGSGKLNLAISDERYVAPRTIDSSAADLAPFKVAPPPGIRVPRIRDAVGRCFELAARFYLEHREKGARLIHGEVHGYYLHGWVEIDGLVYDGTCKGLFEREGYYRTMRAMPFSEVDVHELRHFSYGPRLLREWERKRTGRGSRGGQ